MSEVLDLLKKAVEMLEEVEVDEVEELEEIEEGCELSELKPGEVFKIGDHDFIVLEQMNGETAVISKDFMAEDVVFDEDTRDYNKSSLKKLMDNEILKEIETAVGMNNVVEHEVSLTSVDMQNEFGTCRCKVRPITFDEARKYNDLLVNKDLPDWYWTCTPWSTKERGWEYSIAVVSGSGNFNYFSYNSVIGVRPFCILKSNIFVSRGEN